MKNRNGEITYSESDKIKIEILATLDVALYLLGNIGGDISILGEIVGLRTERNKIARELDIREEW